MVRRAFDKAVRRKPPVVAANAGPMEIQLREGAVSRCAEAVQTEQNLRLCGCNSVWYVASSYDPGVPPASFCVNGSQGWPPCDPNLSQPLSNHRSLTSRVASAAGRLRSDGLCGSYSSKPERTISSGLPTIRE